jgi:hypothetical protein
MRRTPLLLGVIALLLVAKVARAQDAPYDAALPGRVVAPVIVDEEPSSWVPLGSPPPSLAMPRYRPRRPPPPRWVFFQLEGGPTYQKLYGFSLVGGEGSMAMNLELKAISLNLEATFAYGNLNLGPGSIVAYHFGFGPSFLARLGRVRIGAGFGFGVLSLGSVTGDPPAMDPTLEGSLLFSVDLVTFGEGEKSALYLGAKLRGSMVLAGDANSALWGPSAVLGVRL